MLAGEEVILSSSSRSGVSERPSESLKLFSRGILESQERESKERGYSKEKRERGGCGRGRQEGEECLHHGRGVQHQVSSPGAIRSHTRGNRLHYNDRASIPANTPYYRRLNSRGGGQQPVTPSHGAAQSTKVSVHGSAHPTGQNSGYTQRRDGGDSETGGNHHGLWAENVADTT